MKDVLPPVCNEKAVAITDLTSPENTEEEWNTVGDINAAMRACANLGRKQSGQVISRGAAPFTL